MNRRTFLLAIPGIWLEVRPGLAAGEELAVVYLRIDGMT